MSKQQTVNSKQPEIDVGRDLLLKAADLRSVRN